ncbi:LacI family transcriptional regulator [Xylanibacillus composti]|uniref:LacI family transcriptional regulator n=1 Tax=Xylanibacillus composti TaxID=1572762 RepID=A0A8J4H5V2_9BACL|nr:LacI family DNA-binding transcriptional regulator [Xylanibacillus composti]MDT9726934.1 LacI family transcriptional regulator [Xylanibacillus composti]GIQ70096.1 LacI family transcriptional regulator [Xylanibacillus composti]
MSITLKEIATKLGVSTSTVSKAINNRPGVSDELRQRIMNLIEEHDLQPKRRNVSQGKDQITNINLLVRMNQAVETDPFYTLITEGIATELQHQRSNLLYYVLSEPKPSDSMFHEMFENQSADGAILVGADYDPRFLHKIASLKIPVVLVDSMHPGFCSVNTDNARGALQAVNHLIDLHHTRIACLSGPLSHNSIHQRYQGYLQGLKDAANQTIPKLIECPGVGVEDGYQAIAALDNIDFTAIFATNDKLAIGAIKALKEKAFHVPKSISIVGFDDIEWGLHTDPPLTTIRIAKQQIGALSAQLIMHLINGDDPHQVDASVATKLIVRSSTSSFDN